MPPIKDHPLRYRLANELHARPFPSLSAPSRAVFLAVKPETDGPVQDRAGERAHLLALLDRHGAPHPQPGATHYSGEIGQFVLKWEQHTEFVTYTMFLPGAGDKPFDPADFDVFPEDWLEQMPGVRVTSAHLQVLPRPEDSDLDHALSAWFVPESLAVASVLGDEAVIAGDFRLDPAGHQRFAIFVNDTVGARRAGRITQRLCEIETYRAMSMLGFTLVRDSDPHMSEMDAALMGLMGDMADDDGREEETLRALLQVSSALESLSARMSFRMGASAAYEAIVNQRIEVLREDRYQGRQTFAEFMMRRYDPAMRTVKSAGRRLDGMVQRATRAADLLRTQVEVGRSAQNQQLLHNMNQRAELQFRLQETVEGLSVVAISYYAVSLVGYLLYPLAGLIGMSKGEVTAVTVVPVVGLVWWMIRRIKTRVASREEKPVNPE